MIVWLNSKFSYRHLTDILKESREQSTDPPNSPKPVTLEEKNFHFNYSSEVFCGPVMRPKLLKFDREIIRFNKNHTQVSLHEFPINFDPTYCFEAGSVENGESKIYATKRIPAWCDRITYSTKAQDLFVISFLFFKEGGLTFHSKTYFTSNRVTTIMIQFMESIVQVIILLFILLLD